MAARCNAKLQVELESAQSAEFQNFNRKVAILTISSRIASVSWRSCRRCSPPLVQEAMKLLIECYQFENRLMDISRIAFDRLEDENPEEGPDEVVVEHYNEAIRPHINAIHEEIVHVLQNKLEDHAMDVAYN